MYLSTPGPEAVPAPSARAGLYIYPRNSNEAVKVSIPPDCLGVFTSIHLCSCPVACSSRIAREWQKTACLMTKQHSKRARHWNSSRAVN